MSKGRVLLELAIPDMGPDAGVPADREARHSWAQEKEIEGKRSSVAYEQLLAALQRRGPRPKPRNLPANSVVIRWEVFFPDSLRRSTVNVAVLLRPWIEALARLGLIHDGSLNHMPEIQVRGILGAEKVGMRLLILRDESDPSPLKAPG